MDVIWRRFCYRLSKGVTSELGKYLFRASNVW